MAVNTRASMLMAVLFGACAGAPTHPDADPAIICSDRAVGTTLWDADGDRCRAYLDACLVGLTGEQRSEWQQAFNACASAPGDSVLDCYAAVPWC